MANPFGLIADGLTGILSGTRGSLTDPDDRFYRLFHAQPNASGISVTATSALGFSAYFASGRNIAEDVAKLPIMFSEPMAGRGGHRIINEHPVLDLVNRNPNPSMSAMSFWETVISHALFFHGGFAEIVRNSYGEPIELWPIPAPIVRLISSADRRRWQYEVQYDGTRAIFDDDEILHVHGLGMNGVTQWVIHQIGATSIGKALATEQHAASFFGNSAILSGVLEAPATLKAEGIKNLAESWRNRHQGSGKAYKTAILPDGVKYQSISSDPEKSQLSAILQANVPEIARWFRMPPNKIQDLSRSTYSNIEQENKSYATDCLQPWSIRTSQEITRKLLKAERTIYVEHDFSMIIEADVVARTDANMKEFQMGMRTPNQLRIYAGLEPVNAPGMDDYWVMSNAQPMKKAVADEPPPAPPALPSDQQEPSDDEESSGDDGEDMPSEGDRIAELTAAFRDVFRRSFYKFIHTAEDQARRAAAKGNITQWMQDYLPKHEAVVAETIEPQVKAFRLAVHGRSAGHDTIAATMAADYVKAFTKRMMDGNNAQKAVPIDDFADYLSRDAVDGRYHANS